MYNMKKIPLPLLLLASLMAYAKPVDMSALTQIASRFYGVAGDAAVSVSRIGGEMVLFRWEDGFVMLASDDCVRPVLAYSQRSSFAPEAMPAHVAEWVEGYRREIASVVAAGISQSASVAAEWAYWLRGADVKSVGDSVGPMLTTAWNQGWGFNAMCPYDENDSVRCYTGCTATATAQIMNYWQHPTVGWGGVAYQHPLYGVLSANFGATTYQWGLMPDTITSVTPDSNIQALALLMYHVGVAVGMNYGTHGSGAAVNAYGSATRPSSENALKTYFKYSPMLYSVFKSEFTDAEWDSIMYGEILAGRPVLYAGHDTSGGHAFVLDGYHEVGDSMASRLFFHVNWGWGGHYDGFYTLDSLAPGAGGIGGNATYTFNMTNSAVVGIAPAALSSDTLVTVSVAPNNIAGGTVSGSGDYIPYEDRVTLWAHAAEGYRFVCWQSGSTQNPVTFLANGDVVDTAIFERLGGDTLGYCFDGLVTSWADDYGSTTEWGIRIPPSMRNVGRNISAVQLFPYVRGVHTVNIYIGNDIATATLVHTKQIIVGDAEYYQWGEFALDTTLPVGSFDVVWVTVSYTGAGYPAASSRYSGNSDGSWYHLPEGWVRFDEEDIFYSTWMLRAVFVPRSVTVDVVPADSNICATYGEGVYLGGDRVTVGAVPLDPRCTFSRWSDGSIENPYTFLASDDITLVAHCNCEGVGVDDVDAGSLIVTVNGRTVGVNQDAEFYDLQGRLLARGREALMPAAGIYILRAAGSVRKVVVMN